MPAYIDRPDLEISDLSVAVAGWVAGHDPELPIRLLVNKKLVAFRRYERPDVSHALPQYPFATGISSIFNLNDFLASDGIEIELIYGQETEKKRCEVVPTLRVQVAEETARAVENCRFCEMHLRCPVCGARRKALSFNGKSIRCKACKASFDQDSRALNMISTGLRLEANLAGTENVSSNPYTPVVIDLIERTTAAGGWVLDCGAGSRPSRTRQVVNVEIADYGSTDVLAVGESLPFEDGIFDAVLSMAVLEHVRDPFRCAKELSRVLKPGGVLIADVPFMQPMHGYPHHYYNMTEQGLRNLFAEDLVIDSCSTPPHGHPIFGIAWMLSQYRQGLPAGLRNSFDAMTLGELTALDIRQFLPTPLATELSEEARQIISCLNTIIAHKAA